MVIATIAMMIGRRWGCCARGHGHGGDSGPCRSQVDTVGTKVEDRTGTEIGQVRVVGRACKAELGVARPTATSANLPGATEAGRKPPRQSVVGGG